MPVASNASDTAGFILAGGRSSRMGSDKALVKLNGRPLLEIAIEILREAGLAAKVAGCRAPGDLTGLPIPPPILDLIPNAGPLGGIHAALSASSSRWNLFLPVDMPLMPSSLLRCLLERATLTGAPVTAARLNGRLEPFPVVVDRSVLSFLEQQLAAGQRACRAVWQSLPGVDIAGVETLLAAGHCRNRRGLPPVHWFQSANTPDDLAWIAGLVNRFDGFSASDIPASGTLGV